MIEMLQLLAKGILLVMEGWACHLYSKHVMKLKWSNSYTEENRNNQRSSRPGVPLEILGPMTKKNVDPQTLIRILKCSLEPPVSARSLKGWFSFLHLTKSPQRRPC